VAEKVLMVDDDKNVLDGIGRQLRKAFHIETALSATEGLEAVKSKGPYAVVVSDLRMPGMNGIEFLKSVRVICPDTVRIMLSGNADLDNTVQAVNEGYIFRFFIKPCPSDILAKGIETGIEQYRLVTAERDLLQKTLKGSIKVLTEVLSIVNPEAFGRSSRIAKHVKQIASYLGVSEAWQFELAAMLSQVGCFTLPESTLKKLYQGKDLFGDELQLFERHPLIASNLLSHIPRLENVAEIIQYQEKHFDGSGIPQDDRRGEAIPLCSRVLKVALDLDVLEAKKFSKYDAIQELKKRKGRYDPAILEAMEAVFKASENCSESRIYLRDFQAGMILCEDIYTTQDRLVISRGQEINSILINRLMTFAKNIGIREPIAVRIPVAPESSI
jgi:response regulator RpfG family c-di-GMP phosphodiesterase